jgi:hypothetical protein
MTDSNRSLSELPALITERRRYESWLVALDARRESTPGHVFERVRTDYQTRLERVRERVEAHRHIIDEERTNVQSRLSLLEAEEQMRRDERAELDLRAHVGELAGGEAVSAFKAVDDAIGQLVAEKQGLQGRIDELAAMLEQRDTPPLPRASGATVAADVAAAASASRVSGALEAPHVDHTAAPEPARAATPAEEHAPVETKAADGSFDELAFLNTVVGQDDNSGSLVAQSRRDAALVRDERAAESLLSGLTNQTANAAAEKPLAANVTGNVPITLRAGATEQPKTLKCNECGGMNYPTEWYCERCGAELAAL